MSTYIADSTDFTTVANAIRAKTGSAAQLSFPTGMAAAISAISGATEPYVEKTLNANYKLISAVLHGYTAIHDYEFSYCAQLPSIILPDTIVFIGSAAFVACSSLVLTTLPSNLKSIGQVAFADCPSLAITDIPATVETVGNNVFRNDTGLTTITFHGKPKSLSTSAFQGCTNITTINVPWASGEVAGAPWGATNATVNYNYSGV